MIMCVYVHVELWSNKLSADYTSESFTLSKILQPAPRLFQT